MAALTMYLQAGAGNLFVQWVAAKCTWCIWETNSNFTFPHCWKCCLEWQCDLQYNSNICICNICEGGVYVVMYCHHGHENLHHSYLLASVPGPAQLASVPGPAQLCIAEPGNEASYLQVSLQCYFNQRRVTLVAGKLMFIKTTTEKAAFTTMI